MPAQSARAQCATARPATETEPAPFLRVPVPERRARRLPDALFGLLLIPLVFATLFLGLRQDLRVDLERQRIDQLTARHQSVRREIGVLRRELAARTDLAQIAPHLQARGLQPTDNERIYALSPAPVVAREAEPLPAAVLDFLAGVGTVRAAATGEAEDAQRAGGAR